MLRRLLIILLLFFVAVLLIRKTNLVPSLRTIFKPKAAVVDETPLVVAEIRNIAQLMTVEAYGEVVVDSTRYPLGIPPRVFNALPGNPLGLLGASQLVLIVRGKVVAGIDLKSLDKNNVHIKGDSLFVQLPRAQVLDVITNPSDVEPFIERGNWDERAATVLKVRARNNLVQQALAQGALQQADSKARELVYELLKNTGYKWIMVTTAIQPSAPSGKQ
jgi:Protein of unknown function (DUF4230)